MVRAGQLSLLQKRRLAVAACAAAEQMLAVAQQELCDDSMRQAHATATRAANELRAALATPVRGGRGLSIRPRLPTLKLEKSTMFSTYIDQADRFKEECGWTPDEFRGLLADVRPVLLRARDADGNYTRLQNIRRRSRAFRYSPEERLFAFLAYMRQYRPLRAMAKQYGISFNALRADVKWLRDQLVAHPALVQEVQWPSAAERAETRRLLVAANLLPDGFEEAVAIGDGAKTPAQKPRDREAEAADYNGNKGYGKTHMMYTDLWGKPVRVEAGLWGHHNDRGLHKLSDFYNNPDKYLSPGENLLLDGIFQGELHKNTEKGALIPADRAQIAAARNPARRAALKASNRQQRRLRVPVEQTIGIIKQYKVVSHHKFRGDVRDQGTWWMLATQLTARTMRLRNSYPRGRKWLRGELEEWERELGEYLEVDPLAPELYR